MMPVALAVLVLHPILAEPAELRLVALGNGAEPVTWFLDGNEVATSGDRQAVNVAAGPGAHVLEARTAQTGPWMAVARVDARGTGLDYVPSWTASTPGQQAPETPQSIPWPAFPMMVLVVAAVLARRVSKGP